MAFSWISITAGVTNITAAQMNEVKTNVDTLASQLGVSNYSWVTLPVTQYNPATSLQVNELQDAIDYIDSMNTCVSYNATYDTGDLSSDDNSIHTGKDVSVLSGQDSGIHTGKDASILSGQDSGIHTGKDVSILASQNTTYHNNRDVSVLSGQYSTVYNPQYSSNCATNWGTAQNGVNIHNSGNK